MGDSSSACHGCGDRSGCCSCSDDVYNGKVPQARTRVDGSDYPIGLDVITKHFVEGGQYYRSWCGHWQTAKQEFRDQVGYEYWAATSTTSLEDVTCCRCLDAVIKQGLEAEQRLVELEKIEGERASVIDARD